MIANPGNLAFGRQSQRHAASMGREAPAMKHTRFDAELREAQGHSCPPLIPRASFTIEPLECVSALGVQVRLACDLDDQAAADRLVAMRYAWRGYATDAMPDKPPSTEGRSPDSSTLLAYRGDRLVGTITLGLDGHSALFAANAHPAIVDAIKRGGRRVVELTRLAVRDTVDSRMVLAELFRAAYCIGRLVHGATDALIEVNPRHAGFYSRVFGFVRLGDEWLCARVNAPAVLMHLDVSKLDLRLGLAARPQNLSTQAA